MCVFFFKKNPGYRCKHLLNLGIRNTGTVFIKKKTAVL
eukprot:SAG31_NODE_13936_length_832_cov_2.115332_1_plen_37_part_10